MTHHGPSWYEASSPLRSRSPCGVRSHPSIPPCGVLSASRCSALRLPFGLPSLPPCGGRLRFGGLLSPNWRQIALPAALGQWPFAKSRRSPHLSSGHPQVPVSPSPVLPHAEPATHAAPRRRGTVATGIAAVVVAVTLGVAGVLSLHAPNAGARTARESGGLAHLNRESALVPASSTLGSAVGTTALGLRTSYYEPPALSDPQNPGAVVNSGPDQPDPFVFVQNGRYYLFTSQDQVPQDVPVRSGTVFGQWGAPSDALPDPPAWATPHAMWAPDVAQFGNHYMMYFTSDLAGSSPPTMCIGDAISTNPAGPYIPSQTPFICQLSMGGSIDPRVFVDSNGQASMIWKSDQNSLKMNIDQRQIWSQPLSADGLHLLGAPTAIFSPDEAWQNAIVEAPQMVLVQRRLLPLLLRRVVQPDELRDRRRPLRRARRSLPRHVVDPAPRLQPTRGGTRRGVGLLQQRRHLDALHPMVLPAAQPGPAAACRHGAPRLRARRAVPRRAAPGGPVRSAPRARRRAHARRLRAA